MKYYNILLIILEFRFIFHTNKLFMYRSNLYSFKYKSVEISSPIKIYIMDLLDRVNIHAL